MATAGSSRDILSVNDINLILSDDSESDLEDEDFSFDSSESESDDSDDEPLSRKRARVRTDENDNEPSPNVWRSGDFSPSLFPFTVTNSGVNGTTNITETSSELDCFRLFFNPRIMDIIVTETNRFFVFLRSLGPLQRKSKLWKWEDTSAEEMYVFFAINMLMSLQKRPKVSDYWSTDRLMGNPIFGEVMSSLRFCLLMRMLHFNSKENFIEGDKLCKIRPIINEFKSLFSDSFIPFQNLVIDESLMLWKGRLAFKQYIPSKRHRFGVKFFIICDCKTGYILGFIIYVGATTEIIAVGGAIGISGSVVLTLMEPFLNKGHTLFTDNWYTSPALAEKLFAEKTGTCGTVKKNRMNMPVFPSKMEKGELVEKHKQDVLAVKWHDRRDVHMLTTVDPSGETPSGKINWKTKEDILKPNCVISYNKNMGSIDKSDMQLSFVECVRKSLKWYKKLFFHILDLASLNAYIIQKEAQKKEERARGF